MFVHLGNVPSRIQPIRIKDLSNKGWVLITFGLLDTPNDY